MTATQSTAPGAADVIESSIIQFADGLVGCGTWKRFILLSDADEALPIAILKCLDEPGVSLMVTDPAVVLPGYAAALTPNDRRALGLGGDERPMLLCTLTITPSGEITANLLGPLAINAQTRTGKQLVLADSHYSAKHPVGSIKEHACWS